MADAGGESAGRDFICFGPLFDPAPEMEHEVDAICGHA
jgi:hypothetical protein